MADYKQQLLTTQLPQSVYDLCPEIPEDLKTANFDAVNFVNK